MENRKYNFVLSDETSKMIDDHLENSRHRYRSAFVSEAIRRYCCDLDTSKHRNVMTEEIERIMDAKISNLSNRIAHINFKIAVEIAFLSLMISDRNYSMDDGQIQATRSAALKLVRKSSDFVPFETALEDTRELVQKMNEKNNV